MLEQELFQLEQQNLLRRLTVVESSRGPYVTIHGNRFLLMCSNDYLGLANHPMLCKAAARAMEQYGFGSGASRLVSGTSEMHKQLEDKLAKFKHAEAAILFNSGYAANTGVIQSLAREGDILLSDCLNHASIVDGCRLSKADLFIYNHKDICHVEQILKKCKQISRKLIVTDGVFSMDGDIAPLPDLVALAEKYGAMLMVDDAHATGVLGKTGRGTAEYFGLEGRIPIQMGTLSKALGSFGAFVAGSKNLVEFLVNSARSFIYSTALPPLVCAASIAALDIVNQEHDRREKLWNNREQFIKGLREMGIDSQSETPIIPVMIGDSKRALQASERLFEEGLYASAIRPPTVPEGSARIRVTIMATHSHEDIDHALDAFQKLKQEGYL